MSSRLAYSLADKALSDVAELKWYRTYDPLVSVPLVATEGKPFLEVVSIAEVYDPGTKRISKAAKERFKQMGIKSLSLHPEKYTDQKMLHKLSQRLDAIYSELKTKRLAVLYGKKDFINAINYLEITGLYYLQKRVQEIPAYQEGSDQEGKERIELELRRKYKIIRKMIGHLEQLAVFAKSKRKNPEAKKALLQVIKSDVSKLITDVLQDQEKLVADRIAKARRILMKM